MLDGFDFTILTFVLADIQRSFTVDNALAGALGTVTLMFRLDRRRRRGHGRRSVGPQAAARCSPSSGSRSSPCSAGFRRPTRPCSPAARCSASGWAANGRPACRWRSSTCPIGCGAQQPASFRARGRGDTSCPRSCFRRSIRCCAGEMDRGLARDVLDRRDSRAARHLDSLESH